MPGAQAHLVERRAVIRFVVVFDSGIRFSKSPCPHRARTIPPQICPSLARTTAVRRCGLTLRQKVLSVIVSVPSFSMVPSCRGYRR